MQNETIHVNIDVCNKKIKGNLEASLSIVTGGVPRAGKQHLAAIAVVTNAGNAGAAGVGAADSRAGKASPKPVLFPHNPLPAPQRERADL